jgi:hypothetical protein
VWLDRMDPCRSREIIERDDPVTEMLGAVLNALHALFGDSKFTTADIVRETTPDQRSGQ